MTAFKTGVSSTSMSKFIPVGIWIESPSIGAKSPPQVDGSDQALT